MHRTIQKEAMNWIESNEELLCWDNQKTVRIYVKCFKCSLESLHHIGFSAT